MRNVYHNSHIYFPTLVGLYLATYVVYIYLPSTLSHLKEALSTAMFVLLVLAAIAALGFIFKPAKKLEVVSEKPALVRSKVKENAKPRKRK